MKLYLCLDYRQFVIGFNKFKLQTKTKFALLDFMELVVLERPLHARFCAMNCIKILMGR